MVFEELIKALENSDDLPLQIVLPKGDIVPKHFHVTEVGLVQKDFIDCGGTFRQSISCMLQVWTAEDFDHRLASKKLLKILNLANKTLDLNNLPVEMEYGTEVSSQYQIDSVISHNDGFYFFLTGKKTDCLAPDKCGVSQCKAPGCCQ